MKLRLATLIILSTALSSCSLADRMNYLINESTNSINQNACNVRYSTQIILENARLVDESTRTVRENRLLLEAETQ